MRPKLCLHVGALVTVVAVVTVATGTKPLEDPVAIVELVRDQSCDAFRAIYKNNLQGTTFECLEVGEFRALVGAFEENLLKSCYFDPHVASITYDRNLYLQWTQNFVPSHLVLDRAYARGGTQLNGTFGPPANIYLLDTRVAPELPDFTARVHVAREFTEREHKSERYGAIGQTHKNAYSGHANALASVAMGETLGIAKNAVLHSLPVANDVGVARLSGVLETLAWLCSAEPAIVIIPLSMEACPVLDALIDQLAHRHVIVVPAGNHGRDACQYSPARSRRVVTVGALDPVTGRVAPFSNVGGCVDIYANGINLLTAHNATHLTYRSGTSLSAALVGGALATFFMGDPTEATRRLLNVASASNGVLALQL